VKRHGLDPFSLVAGVVFSSIGVAFLLTRVNFARLHLRWAWPVPLIALGVLIVGLAYRSDRARENHCIEDERQG